MKVSVWLFFLMVIFFGSCSITKHLGEEELLLTKNTIVFDKKYKVRNSSNLKDELETLYRQVPNVWLYKYPARLYQRLKATEADTSKETSMERALRDLATRRIAEKPTIFDESLMRATQKQMENYMHHRGYINAVVTTETYNPPKKRSKGKVISKKIEVTYIVNSKQLYTIDTVIFKSEDPDIQKILEETKRKTYLRKNSQVDGVLYDKEVNRITNTLRNRGYASFTPNYVSRLEGDTTNFKTRVVLKVVSPAKANEHKTFQVGEIFVYPNYNPILSDSLVDDVLIDGLHFLKEKGTEFWIKPKRLSENIFIRRGELFNQRKLNRTNRKLSDLGIFRFVNIRQQIDPIDPQKINFYIQITPRKKWEIGYDLEPNFTERNYTGSLLNLLGISGNIFLGNKNLFRGAEQFSTNAFAGFEFDIDDNFSLNVLDLKLQNSLDIPRFTDYLGLYKGLNKLNIIGDKRIESLKDRATTRLNLSYNYLSISRFYTYHLFNAGWGFDYRDRRNRFIFNNLGIDILRPINIGAAFQDILNENPFLSNSFGDQLFTGFLLRDFNFIYNKTPNVFGESYFFQFYTDISGAEVYTGNKIYNALSNNKDTISLGNGFEFSQYAKFEIDARYTRKFNRKTAVAARINIGIATPYGYSDEVPYVKQFYVGGPQSIRAWGARGLGPGSFFDPFTNNTNNRLLFYQTGDFKFELNGEIRQYLTTFWGRIEGAFFLDIGNVWTLDSDQQNQRPGSVLQWRPRIAADGSKIGDNFFKEMAIGTGLGLRYDFDYFLLRLDLGYRIKNPYKTVLPNGNATYLAYPTWNHLRIQDINYNLGMNYPF